MPLPVTSNATLHALTERLATHSRTLAFPSADKLAAFRQPAPPPQLPVLQLSSRHQEITQAAPVENGIRPTEGGVVRCHSASWPTRGEHSENRCARCEEEELEGFVRDMGVVLRREFDCWVEQCWTEAFHHLFTHTLPTLLIHLILTGSSPTFLRRQVVHGGSQLDDMFQSQILEIMYTELELRLSGARPSEVGTKPPINMSPIPQPHAPAPGLPRDGVCFQDLASQHGLQSPDTDDDHGLCLCQLTSCLGCFRNAAESRKGPISLLPYEAIGTSVQTGWTGGIETKPQAANRKAAWRGGITEQEEIPAGKGFVRNSKSTPTRPIPMFPHPQMTDVLAVEEHLRWRLKEMGAQDPAVESRYGPSTNAAAAMEGVDPQLVSDTTSEDGRESIDRKSSPSPVKNKVVKVKGKGKIRRVVNGGGGIPPKQGKKDEKVKRVCHLPKEWAEGEPNVRNMAIVLTFRHFVKLLHQVATSSSPFSYPSYEKDIADLDRVHPIALYRRLAEPSVARRKNGRETRSWQDCMDKWAEEMGAREKTMGNKYVSDSSHEPAVECYTRAISLDPKKTVYFSNRAVALNALGEHGRAENDCKAILGRDPKNGKAFYQRAVARKGLERWREAESDLKEVLRYQPGNESAKKLMGVVKLEVGKLPKQSMKDVMDF